MTMYLCLSLRKWEDFEFDTNSPYTIKLMKPDYESIGIMEVFTNLNKLQEAYPNSKYVEITLPNEKTPVNLN